MPTTLAHIIGGYTAVELSPEAPAKTPRGRWAWILAFSAFAANAPDLDFLPGLFSGSATEFHRGPSHSVFALLCFALLMAAFTRRWIGHGRAVFLAAAAAYGSHIFLDLLIPDPMGQGGLQLLWPVSPRAVTFELPWLAPLNGLRMFDALEFNNSMVKTLMSWSGVRVFLVDALLVSPLLLIPGVRVWRRRRASTSG